MGVTIALSARIGEN